MGSEDEAEQSLGRPSRQATAGSSGHANSPHPSSREGHLSTAGWNSGFLLSDLIDPKRPIREADIRQSRWHVRKVPTLDIAPHYSITSSTRIRNGSVIFKPSTLAVVKLRTRSNLRGLLDGQIGRLRATKDLVRIFGGTAQQACSAWT